MTDPDRYESALDRAVREAAERGAFDNLPGAGRPLPQIDGPDDELWWVRRWVEREGLSRDALLPPSLQLRKEIDRLPATLRELRSEQAVRDAVRELNLRVVEHLRHPSGPAVPVGRVDADAAVARWRAERTPEPPAAAPPPAHTAWWAGPGPPPDRPHDRPLAARPVPVGRTRSPVRTSSRPDSVTPRSGFVVRNLPQGVERRREGLG